MNPADLSTGIPSLDAIVERIMLGDNIVWLVSALEQYDYFASRFLQHCARSGREVCYVHFDHRVDYSRLPGVRGVQPIQVDAADGPARVADQLAERIQAGAPGAHYLFDNLSILCEAWEDEQTFVEFFRFICPLLFKAEAIAYFGLLRGKQSNATVAKIRDTTQILLDVYEEGGLVVLQPIKVWDRYSDRMFHAHVLWGDQLIPADTLRAPADRSSLSQVELLVRYPERTGNDRSLSIREEMIRTIVSNRPEYIRIARNYFSVSDLLLIKARVIGSGTIGGKAAGMLLSDRILRAACARDGMLDGGRRLKAPESFFLGSDVYFNFLINNNLMHWLDLKHLEPTEMRSSYGEVQEAFAAGEFPKAIRDGLKEVARSFAGCPIVVRSSSLLEDSVNMSFAGKYESVFLGNQGEPEECMQQLLRAIKQVYASSLGPDALEYRRRHGLLELQEHMAVLIQKVEGSPYGNLFFPPVAGVAFSRNPYPWSERIDTRAGLVRLVFGLGTRAVNRVEADYPRLVALSHPALHPDGDYMTSRQYHQQHLDAIDMSSNTLRTFSISDVISGDYGHAFYVFSVFQDGFLRAPVVRNLRSVREGLTVTFQNLLARTDFVDVMRYVLDRIEEAYRYPVDIEFTLDVEGTDRVRFCLLQCRPLTQRTEFQPARIPSGLPPERVLFVTRKGVPNGELHNIRYIVLIDSRSYDSVPDNATRTRLARAVGALNHLPELIAGQFVLIGPGRWGSVNIELGVPVTYSEINNARLLMEMARPKMGYTPEVSYGTHFFQDLVESQIFYLPLYPEAPACVYNEGFFSRAGNSLAALLPDYAPLEAYLKVIDVPACSGGLYLHVALNQMEFVGIGYLAERSAE